MVCFLKPIYKNKGSQADPDNYRGISIVSCFGKLFTAILSKRLQKFSDNCNVISDAKAGFRKSYSTIDNIYVLIAVIDIFKYMKAKLFCVFIDFSKAFDTVWRSGLWLKMIKNNIGGKCFRIIHSMYQNIKSCVLHIGNQSPYFLCENGVRQGENLSPFLFALYLNDLKISL